MRYERFTPTYDLFIRANFYFGLAVIMVFMPFSKYIMSIGQFLAAGAWALVWIDKERFREYFRRDNGPSKYILAVPFLAFLLGDSIARGFRKLFTNVPAMVLMSIYLLHVAGLIFTVDFGYAFKDLRVKIPIFILPLFMSTIEPLGKKGFYRFMLLLLITLLAVTGSNTWNYIQGNYVDIRDISRHISHIILALLICLGIFSAFFFIAKRQLFPAWAKILLALAATWLTAYLVLSQSFTGIAVLLITLGAVLLVLVFRSSILWLKAGAVAALLALALTITLYVRSVVRDYYTVKPVDFAKLDKRSAGGRPYFNYPERKEIENGNYVWVYIQWNEIMKAWKQRSSIPFDSLDRKGQPVHHTLIRFLTSKGARKDSAAMASLSDEEIRAIENGTASVIYMDRFSLRGRIYELLMGYDTYRGGGNPTGFSMIQRFEFWKASAAIIKDYWLTGVGTGDMNTAFKNRYEIMHSRLAEGQRWRSHNQYLSIFIGFGVIGIAWFLFALFYPAVARGGFRDWFFLVFFIIVLTSMLTEDTIESSAGVTFFFFYYSFFLFGRKEKDLLI